ncbi:HAD family hydrolase [Chloroflexota bacterium]
MPVRAIIFDASGTFLNDIYPVWKATSDAYASLGIDGIGTIEEFKDKFKLPASEYHRGNGVALDLIHELDKKFRESYPQYNSGVGIFPDVIDVLHELKEKGILLGVVSNIPSVFLAEHLRNFGVDDYFDVVTGQEDCDEQKPSPKPVACTIEKLGVNPGEVMFVGDMEEDIIAGKGAGAVTVAMVRDEGYHPRWRLEKHSPDFFVSDLRELLQILYGDKIK